MLRSWEMRVVPPGTVGSPGPGEWNGNGEANRIDCVRTVHKHRNLLAHAPDALHEEVTADYTDMIYAETAKEAQVQTQGVPAQMAAALSGGGHQPGGGRRPAVRLRSGLSYRSPIPFETAMEVTTAEP